MFSNSTLVAFALALRGPRRLRLFCPSLSRFAFVETSTLLSRVSSIATCSPLSTRTVLRILRRWRRSVKLVCASSCPKADVSLTGVFLPCSALCSERCSDLCSDFAAALVCNLLSTLALRLSCCLFST